MKNKLSVAFLTLLFLNSLRCQIFRKVILAKLFDCPNVDNMKGDLRLQYNLTSEKNIKYLSGSVDLKRDFDELYDGELLVDQWRGKEYKNNFFVLKEKYMCKSLHKYMGPVFTNIVRKAKVKNPERCPIKKSFLEIKDTKIDLNGLRVPLLPGKYRITLSSIKEGEKQSCVKAILIFK